MGKQSGAMNEVDGVEKFFDKSKIEYMKKIKDTKEPNELESDIAKVEEVIEKIRDKE